MKDFFIKFIKFKDFKNTTYLSVLFYRLKICKIFLIYFRLKINKFNYYIFKKKFSFKIYIQIFFINFLFFKCG